MKRKIFALTSIFLSISLSASYAADNLTSLFSPIARGAQSDESAYFVLTDRFSNGNTANDFGGFATDNYDSGFDDTSDMNYHGGDFVGLMAKLPYLKGLGFTSVWVTPPVKQQTMQGRTAAYHGYWGLDFTTIDPHLGTEAEFKTFVDKAHALGIKVIIDIVVNHTADVIQYTTDNNYIDHKSAPYRDASGVAFDPIKLAGKSSFPLLSATKSFAKEPVLTSQNSNIKKPAFLNDVTNYHNRGDSTWSGTSVLDGDFYGLDDLFTEKPEVVKGWIEVWSDWIRKFGIDGYRIDTAKHVNPEFWNEFIPAILGAAKAAGKTDFPIYGEVFDGDPIATSKFVREQSFPGVLDFPFQSVVTSFVTSGTSAEKLTDLFNADDLYTTASTSAYGLTTFLGNHDMGRIGMFIENSAGNDAEALKKSQLANALLFLLRGGPALYYGDEKGMTGSGGDRAARQDMFATKVSDWQDEKRIGASPIGVASAFDTINPLETQITQLQSVIAANPALRSGTQQIRFAQGSLFAATRYLNGQEYVIAFNAGSKSAEGKFKVSTLGSKWKVLNGAATAYSASKENFAIKLDPQSYVVLKADSAFKSKVTPAIKINTPRSDFALDYLLEISATATGDEYNQVNFMMREVGKNWVNLGTADRKTFKSGIADANLYRVYIEPLKFAKGTQLEFVAILKNAAGKTVTSKIVKASV